MAENRRTILPVETGAPGGGSGASGGRRVFLDPKVEAERDHLETIINSYSRGKLSAKEVKREFRTLGWSADLRRGSYEVEAVDPSGAFHLLTP